ncbi:hypothetical protein HO173_001734 [Letharia columbiana]|uniref:Uncharacterized protein n=1 Tax=Letharia columbiana TaxID=112416 RepID=A0A8H6G3X3_9LECA|nr:uncharacterized protein HO173_001734 [Letharia columbiana]KAF6240124.1 hypothetical protein HO173_001734 [Letharia columbiana]
MLGIEEAPEDQKSTACPRGVTGCGLHELPAELLFAVMKYLPDMAALSRLFTAYPRTFIVFNLISKEIFAGIVDNMSAELRDSALDVLAVRSHPPIHPSQITDFIKHHLDAKVCYTQPRLRRYPLSAILDLITISESIESLTESFASDRVLGPCIRHSMPLSPIELHRIRRSFWRFQLCYDMCHPEEVSSSREICEVKSRGTRQYVQCQSKQPISGSVPNWLQGRSEAYRPEALSRFLPNLSRWEHDELEAVRFHLALKVNRLQYLRSCGSNDELIGEPALLQRLIRDIDHWDTGSPEDHVLVAAFRQSQHARSHPIVWHRIRHCYDASIPNTPRRSVIQSLQVGHPQWGWCLWDEKRLVKRGMIDIEYEGWVDGWKMDDESKIAKICERRAAIGEAHSECIAAQYTPLDQKIAAQYAIDAQIHLDRLRWDRVRELGSKERQWMPTELDCIYSG